MQAFLARWMPIDASAHGPQLDALTAWVHWLMAALFVGWTVYFLYVLFRFRAGANPQASYEGAESHFSSYIEAGVAIVEVILLVGFAIPAWAAWTDIPETGDAFEVRVVAQQFAWNVHYPGPDGVFGRTDISLVDDVAGNPVGLDRSDPAAADDIIAINQMHLPVDRDIVVHLTSRDVIHSFFLPQMRVKQDAIPGMMTPIHFRAVMATPEESRFPNCAANKECWEIACAQLCGLTHYRMQGYYQVLPQAEFDAWMAQQQAALGNDNP
jgi:cytochrome c oxidase subunit 2